MGFVGQPKISDKRWSVDLEKRIQKEHYDEESYRGRYAFNKDTNKEIFVVDTPPPYPSGCLLYTSDAADE